MKTTKLRSITILALSLLTAFILSLAIGAFAITQRVSAATYAPTTIFSSSLNSNVGASEKGEGEKAYVQFTYKNSASDAASTGNFVSYRRDLALKWFDKEGAKYLSMQFSFPELNFKTFSIAFESAEENITKEEKSVNSVVFKNDEGAVKVAVKNADEKDNTDWEKTATFTQIDVSNGVKLSLGESENDGAFQVLVNDKTVGEITNVGANYLEYVSSSSSTPRVPLSFKADELVGGEGAKDFTVLLKELNGQSFELNEENKVLDNAAPVLVLNEEVHAYTLGAKWNASYEAIDVCDTSVTVQRYYYVLKKDGDKYVAPADEDYKTLSTSTVLTDRIEDEETQYVSIRFQLSDDAGVSGDDKYIYLDWYATENAVVTKGEGESAQRYIKIIKQTEGPHYVGITADEATSGNLVSDEAKKAAEDYQKAVDEAAKNATAGSGAYFYLPSLRGLIESEHADYRNLTFNVYYRKSRQTAGEAASSQTSLKFNALKFEISDVGVYEFCVLASDASSNSIKLYYDGELVNVTSENIWEIDEIPKFRFESTYNGGTIEDPKAQDTGYRDSTYTLEKFKIVALSGYETEYKLYHLNEEKLSEKLPSYSSMVSSAKSYVKAWKESGALDSISEFQSDISEDDKRWDDTDNKFHWSVSNLSFMPAERGYYVVELTVTESYPIGNSVKAYQIIEVKNPIDTPPVSDNWAQNNIASIVLFSIAAVLAIIIVILFVVKPSEKTVEEVDLAKLKKVEGRKSATLKNHKDETQNDEE